MLQHSEHQRKPLCDIRKHIYKTFSKTKQKKGTTPHCQMHTLLQKAKQDHGINDDSVDNNLKNYKGNI